jgi:hypothetical protein
MNPDVAVTLDEAVQEVLSTLTGLDISYRPELDRYRAVTRHLNKALRLTALDSEWSYYSSVESVGTASLGDTEVQMRATIRPRIINDDAVRFVDDNEIPRVWAYFLPRDSLHKYNGRRQGLWCAHTRSSLQFSRALGYGEAGLTIQVPVMREPQMFRLPALPEDENEPVPTVPQDVREQTLDFDYPDLVLARAAYLYAQSDPVAQPRVQTLEDQYKTMLYALTERDERNTDSAYQNDFFVPIEGDLFGPTRTRHSHPHADERGWI